MKLRSALTVVAVAGMLVAAAFGIPRMCSNGLTQVALAGVSDQPIKVINDSGDAVDLLPLVAQRQGEPREIAGVGDWSLTRLGYSDIVFPCADRYEAIEVEYALPEDAAQGPDNLYALALIFRIELSAASDNGEVQVSALTNGAMCAIQSFETRKTAGVLAIDWADQSGGSQSTSSLTVDSSTSGFMSDAHLWHTGVKPGSNKLTISLSQYGGALVKSLRVSAQSGIKVIKASNPNEPAHPSELPRLSSGDESRAKTIALSDSRIQQLTHGREYEVTLIAPQGWGQPGTGDARVDIRFKVAHQIEYDWPWPPPPTGTKPLSGKFWVRTMSVAIDLQREVVTGISPVPQPIALESDRPETISLSNQEMQEAKRIVLADQTVGQLLVGKQYKVGQRYDDTTPDTRIGVMCDENGEKIGAGLEIWFDRACTFTDFGTGPIRGILVCVNLEDAVVDSIDPLH